MKAIKKRAIKRCKPTNKASGYNSCNEVKEMYKYGMCEDCYFNWLRTTDKGLMHALSKIPTAKNNTAKENKAKSRKSKIENKSIAVLKLEAKKPFQKLIRIRDHRIECICCGVMLPFNIGEYDAGHYLKAEIYSGLIFHPDNVHGQRVYCNQHLHGNEAAYTNGIIKRIGWAQYNMLNTVKDSLKSYKWDRYKLIELKKHYQKELKEVEAGKDINEVDFNIGIL